jgi:phage baseplate assembly protein W
MANIDYPYHFDPRGQTAETDDEDHARDLIEQVLFTAPGERVNRPTFGSGLLQLVFAPAGDAAAAAVRMLVQGALQQFVGETILVESVDVVAADSTLTVTVGYILRRDQQRRVAQFRRDDVSTAPAAGA